MIRELWWKFKGDPDATNYDELPYLWKHLRLWQIRHSSFKCLFGFHKKEGDSDFGYCDNCPSDFENGRWWPAEFGGK